MRISLFNTILLCFVFIAVTAMGLYVDQRLTELNEKTMIELQLLEEKIDQTQRLIIQTAEIREK